MDLLHAIVRGVVQGVTEFFPISSSGHLALVPWLLGWDDFGGDDQLEKAFDVAVHLGTLVGAIAYFRKDILTYLRTGFGGLVDATKREEPEFKAAWLLVVSAVPAGLTGLTLKDLIDRLDDVYWLIGLMLIVFGLVLLVADRLGGSRTVGDYKLRDALAMGVGQALALQPGVSRSGVTITVGRWLGFDRDTAARLSFLMSLPVIAGAGVVSFLDLENGVPRELWSGFAVGMAAAALTGWAAVWATLSLVRTRTFLPFVVYRVIVGAAVLALALAGFQGA